MSGDQLSSSSFGYPNAHSPTPRQTPTSATFPSPVLTTPKQQSGQFYDAAGWTPRFAEEYSVFNLTPGNLRANQGPFPDAVSISPTDNLFGHKRLLSTSCAGTENPSYKGLLSPDPNLQLPYADPTRSELPSENSVNLLSNQTLKPNSQSKPGPSTQTSVKSAKQATTQKEKIPLQIVTPPPTTHKGRRKLAPKLKMQEDQSFGQQELMDPSQAPEMHAFLGHAGDLFSYPMSAPVTAPENFWDPSAMNLPMDMDFGATAQNLFSQSGTPYHRPSGSFDWNSDVPLFETPQATAPTSSQETIRQPPRRERALAPKPPAPDQLPTTNGGHPMINSFGTSENPFGIVNHTGAVDPGMLLSRPQTSTDDSDFHTTTDLGLQGHTIPSVPARVPSAEGIRRTASFKSMTEGKGPDRRLTRSPVKPSPARPSLGRSQSENRGRRSLGRGPVVNQTAVPRPSSQARSGSGMESGRPNTRASGRVSPLKKHRLSGLASIPESASRGVSSASIRFTIDSNGRARAEAAHSIYDSRANIITSRSSEGSQSWNESGDESSSDDEPIIIPSRNSSFNTSFALPDPLKPVGSIFHSSRRSISDRSTSTVAASDTPNILIAADAESEAETLMNDTQDQEGDAASELLKLIENRKNRSGQLGGSSRLLSTSHVGMRSNTRSPASLNEFSDMMEIRCVCHRNGADENDGYMVRCDSCERWLHGQCIKINQRTLPRVYICVFCVQTPHVRGGRMRSSGNRGIGAATSPLANKSFKMLR